MKSHNFTNKTNITETNLLENNWQPLIWEPDLYHKTHEYDKNFVRKNKKFHCVLIPYKYSRTNQRLWSVTVDNNEQKKEFIGSMDVNTYEQIDKFIELLSE